MNFPDFLMIFNFIMFVILTIESFIFLSYKKYVHFSIWMLFALGNLVMDFGEK